MKQKMENKNLENRLSGMNILAVDDDKIYLVSWKLGFGKECNKFDTASNERDALDLLEKNVYDIVITDGAFPEYEGQYFGHGSKDESYRGKNIAKYAKEKGAYVIGISSEPEKLRCDSIDTLMKKPVEIIKLRKIVQNIDERRYE